MYINQLNQGVIVNSFLTFPCKYSWEYQLSYLTHGKLTQLNWYIGWSNSFYPSKTFQCFTDNATPTLYDGKWFILQRYVNVLKTFWGQMV